MKTTADEMLGKRFTISGMELEIIADKGDSWQTRNITTGETVMFKKSVLDKAIRLGKAEISNRVDD